jgi:hypothetical protein
MLDLRRYRRLMHPPSILTGLAELPDTRMQWFGDWYDGPVTGLAMHDGHEYWFVMVTNDGGEHWDFEPRIYVLHQLSPAQLAQAWDGHRSFAALDMPGCIHSPPCPVSATIKDGELAALRERWPPELEEVYETAPVIGWFRSGTAQRR